MYKFKNLLESFLKKKEVKVKKIKAFIERFQKGSIKEIEYALIGLNSLKGYPFTSAFIVTLVMIFCITHLIGDIQSLIEWLQLFEKETIISSKTDTIEIETVQKDFLKTEGEDFMEENLKAKTPEEEGNDLPFSPSSSPSVWSLIKKKIKIEKVPKSPRWGEIKKSDELKKKEEKRREKEELEKILKEKKEE